MIELPEIKQDLADTQRELKDLQDELQVLKRNPQTNKVRIYMLTGSIHRREEFCLYLENLIKERKEKDKTKKAI